MKNRKIPEPNKEEKKVQGHVGKYGMILIMSCLANKFVNICPFTLDYK